MGKIFSIYCFTNKVNNKKYIGSTIVAPRIRYNQHLYNATHEGTHQYNYPLYQAIRKYGIENFDFEVIEQFLECSEKKLRKKEQEYIIKFNTLSPNGYNQTLDTEHPINAKESYEKMSNTKRELAKRVAEVDKDNNIIKIWRSISDCAEETQLGVNNISGMCRGEQHTVSGRKFYLLDDNDNLIIPIYTGIKYKGESGTTQKHSNSKRIAKIDLETNEVLQIYETAALAARENNCDRSSIIKVCKNVRNKTGGFKWRYVDE